MTNLHTLLVLRSSAGCDALRVLSRARHFHKRHDVTTTITSAKFGVRLHYYQELAINHSDAAQLRCLIKVVPTLHLDGVHINCRFTADKPAAFVASSLNHILAREHARAMTEYGKSRARALVVLILLLMCCWLWLCCCTCSAG